MHTPEDIADAIIQKVGKNIVLALPLGLGKATHIANALTQRAINDSGIQLRIFTALTLLEPEPTNTLQRRFFEPARHRLFGNSPPLLYAQLLREQKLPGNIEVNEFFLMAGQWLSSPTMQQHYIPANYTHALYYLLDHKPNVVAQLVGQENGRYSLGSNPDITYDLLKLRSRGEIDFVFAAQANSEMPYMFGDAEIAQREIDVLLDGPETDSPLYTAPKRPVTLTDHAIGLHVSALIEDGGTLQIGIGSIGDAVCHALILRQKQNSVFKQLISALNQGGAMQSLTEPFSEGLYGLSEMFVDGFLHLADHEILTREVDGAVLHAAFFVDCKQFYQSLREMDPATRARFKMMSVAFTNELYGDEQRKIGARKKARFINSAMMVTLRGATISDALEDGRVVSGVGGQYNFVSQAFALKGARSIITINATRESHGETVSNIVWSYGHETIPWHLRDIVVTEYGVADLRGKPEAGAIKAMLAIADSRFQPALLEQAKRAGKLEPEWNIPQSQRNNTPEQLKQRLAQACGSQRINDVLPAFPFGTDFTEVEQRLLPALNTLKSASAKKNLLLRLLYKGFRSPQTEEDTMCLQRMELDNPGNFKDRLYKRLLLGALHENR